MISQLRPALCFLGVFSLLLGIGYPLAMTGLGQLLFPVQAQGSLIAHEGRIVGSTLIGQDFAQARHLQSRPAATEPAYHAGASTGSNLAPSSAALLAAVGRRAAAFGPLPVPSEMATASGSGLDPHISLKSALRQVPRIAAARGAPEAEVLAAIEQATSGPAFGFVGESTVNVLQTNLALDARSK